MATLAELLKGYTPPTESALADPIKQHFKTLPAQTTANLLRQRQNVDQALTMGNNGIEVGNQQAFNEFMSEVPSVAAMTAYHGTPHKIQGQFDINKVGTGEGAQAYGHGMYFAESPQVAKTYMNTGTPVNNRAKLVLELNNNDIDAALAQAHQGIDDAKLISLQNRKLAEKNAQELVDELSYIKNPTEPSLIDKLLGKSKGNLYKVDIPDEHIPNMLDWDKPLSQQPKSVQKAFQSIIKKDVSSEGMDIGGAKILDNRNSQADPTQVQPWVMKSGNTMFGLTQKDVDQLISNETAKGLYGKLAADLGSQRAASEYLQSQGVKGIKYLDQGSRGKSGTSNFVVFDPSTVKILEQNGQPTRKQLLEDQLNKVVE